MNGFIKLIFIIAVLWLIWAGFILAVGYEGNLEIAKKETGSVASAHTAVLLGWALSNIIPLILLAIVFFFRKS